MKRAAAVNIKTTRKAIIKGGRRTEADADALDGPGIRHRIDRLKHKPRPLFDRSTPLIPAPVANVLQELVVQIAVRGMQLDAVETCLPRIARGLCKICNDRWDFMCFQFARDWKFRIPIRKLELTCGGQWRRCDRQRSVPHIGMRDAAAMPELAVDVSAGGMDRIGDSPPTVDLVVAPYTGAIDDAFALLGNGVQSVTIRPAAARCAKYSAISGVGTLSAVARVRVTSRSGWAIRDPEGP